jgi:leader peptidase (prepilin peptidase)/N-methyltransferase
MIAGLLAASLIDAELYIIPLEIPWLLAILGFAVHAWADRPTIPGSLNLLGNTGPPAAALAAGATAGLLISMILWSFGWIPTSFPDGEPMLDVDRRHLQEEMDRAHKAGEVWKEGPLPPPYTAGQIRAEISKEMIFLLPPMLLGGACVAITIWVPTLRNHWFTILVTYNWLDALLGSLLGAMVGAFVVWMTRIVGTLVFRRVAMGLGDVHLMFGVGAIIGAAGATIAFFLAPFFGILYAVYMMIARRGREIPLGPFLSMATALVLLFYCPILEKMTPGFQGLGYLLSELVHGGAAR